MAGHPLHRLEAISLVALGGFVGVNARWLFLGQLGEIEAILLANVVGCLVLGFLVYEATSMAVTDRSGRLVLTTGFCSSLTTYSTFAMQTALAGGPLETATVVVGNYGLGILAVLAGRSLALRLGRGGGPP